MCGKKFNSRAPGKGAGIPQFRPEKYPMRPNRLALALALAFCSLPMAAYAQDAEAPADTAPQEAAEPAAAEEEGGPVTYSLALTSDYVFRGITQTDYDPALQAGLTYSWDNGLYFGGWASNVDFADPDGPDIEFDTYLGYSTDINDEWNVDVSLVYYSYFGDRNGYGNINYFEGIGKVTWNEMLSLTLAYAPDYSNADYSSFYANLGGTWELGHDFSLNAGIGHSDFSDDNGGYTDWNVGISHAWGPATLALNYYDTDIDFDADAGHHHASDEFVFSITFGN
jgi:uncharacterized protein (TIGR02001 family)